MKIIKLNFCCMLFVTLCEGMSLLTESDTQYPDFTLHGKWKNQITITDSAAVKLTNIEDQSFACDIINFFYSNFPDIESHNVSMSEDWYTVDFNSITSISADTIKSLVKRYSIIRDISINPVSAVDSPNNKPYFNIVTYVFYIAGNMASKTVPHFSPCGEIDPDITKDKFLVVAGGEKKWKREWNIPFSIIKDIGKAVFNVEKHPNDMAIFILYEEQKSIDVFGIMFTNIGNTPFSFLEYLSVIVLKDTMFHIKFESDLKTQQNTFTCKFFIKTTDNEHLPDVTICGEKFTSNIDKRFYARGEQYSNKKRRVDDVEEVSEPPKKKGLFSRLFG